MSSDGSSDWIVPALWVIAISTVILAAVGIHAYLSHRRTSACHDRGGVTPSRPRANPRASTNESC